MREYMREYNTAHRIRARVIWNKSKRHLRFLALKRRQLESVRMRKGEQPKFWGGRKYIVNIRTRISEDQMNKLGDIAAFEDCRKSIIFRQAIDEFIRRKWSITQ